MAQKLQQTSAGRDSMVSDEFASVETGLRKNERKVGIAEHTAIIK